MTSSEFQDPSNSVTSILAHHVESMATLENAQQTAFITENDYELNKGELKTL